MRVAIIGFGGIGRGYTAYLINHGHEPVVWSPSGAALVDFDGGAPLLISGKLEGSYQIRVVRDPDQALESAEAIIITVQANGFKNAFDELAPRLRTGQCVIISSHCSFAALYLHRLLSQRSVDLPIAVWATTVLTARKTGPRSAHISGVRTRLDVATLPTRHRNVSLEKCHALFGDRFDLRENMLAIMLSNLNPPAHVANMLGNLTRAERGEDWSNYGSITPGVGRIIDAMDVERMVLAKTFGLKVRSVQDHYVHSFGVAPGPVGEMAAAVYKKRPELLGPRSLETRFITEDVPFGLVPLEALGEIAGLDLPLHRAGIALFDAICARNFRSENDLLPALNLNRLGVEQLYRELRGD
ncbi:NAD/NADP octopine/nopaline dehydrogenase family protein [Mesorhizobium koreense]|uniref:NAD/NADP octopine/nopaline dehydrogenase family protein n=1 Tax=Mesorhizobium koreense TaxID=3074855 RepID=UPI00287B8B8C|nr:NAD/NADP octopine/nopaline dehydrogenase family protein [Mesorhizobium sp. WR6]